MNKQKKLYNRIYFTLFSLILFYSAQLFAMEDDAIYVKLVSAIQNHDMLMVHTYVNNKNFNPHEMNENGDTYLHCIKPLKIDFSEKNFQKTIKQYFNTKNQREKDVIMEQVLAFDRNPEIIKILIDKGVKLNAKSKNGLTPLLNVFKRWSIDYQPSALDIVNFKDLFLQKLHERVAETLLFHGAATSSALHVIGEHVSNLRLIPMIISHGVIVAHQDISGDTALHIVARKEKYKMFEEICKYIPTSQDRKFVTLLLLIQKRKSGAFLPKPLLFEIIKYVLMPAKFKILKEQKISLENLMYIKNKKNETISDITLIRERLNL